MILRGTGLGLIFVPLTQVAVADLRPQQLAQGTGLFNLSRQLGGSFGIAVAATLLSRFTEQSREALRAHLNLAEPVTANWVASVTLRMQQLGGNVELARQKAYALLDYRLYQQASVIAFEKVFLVMGVTFVLALPLLLAFRTGRTQGGAGAAH
jgi:DHA2 family multidrug resistance protein